MVRQTQGGSYVLEEMNGTVLQQSTAAFRLIPYIQRQNLDELAQELQAEDPESEEELRQQGHVQASTSSEELGPNPSDTE